MLFLCKFPFKKGFWEWSINIHLFWRTLFHFYSNAPQLSYNWFNQVVPSQNNMSVERYYFTPEIISSLQHENTHEWRTFPSNGDFLPKLPGNNECPVAMCVRISSDKFLIMYWQNWFQDGPYMKVWACSFSRHSIALHQGIPPTLVKTTQVCQFLMWTVCS